jgi:hypothetical protein
VRPQYVRRHPQANFYFFSMTQTGAMAKTWQGISSTRFCLKNAAL